MSTITRHLVCRFESESPSEWQGSPLEAREPQASLEGLRTSEIRYRRLFEAARDGILLLEPLTAKITDANPFMAELLGYTRQELLGKELWEIGLLKDQAASQAAFAELRAKRFIRYEDLPLQTRAGQRRDVEFVSNLYDEDGHLVIQCNIRDITQRKRTEAALRQAKQILANHAAELELIVCQRTAALRETVSQLHAFSYSVAHDMRSPLRAMQGFGQFLLDEYGAKLDEQGISYVQQIMRSVVRLDRLIQDVLSHSNELHSAPLMGPVDLDKLMHEILLLYPIAHSSEIQIQSPLPTVWGNETFLTQCFANLLTNAAKFIAPGATPCIQVGAEPCSSPPAEPGHNGAQPTEPEGLAKGQVRIFVQDQGIGIAPQDHQRVFFGTGQINPATAYAGSGIGLTIVRKAAERMGACCGFESDLGKGSRFWIQLRNA